MRRKLGQNATSQLYVTENNIRRLVTDKLGMERACCAENDQRFSQSESTPPMTDPLLRYGGASDSSPRSLTVLPTRKRPVCVPTCSNVLESTSAVMKKVTGILNPSNLVTSQRTINWAEIVRR